MTGWTSQHVRHVGEMLRQGRNPAARVYESIGSDCFLAVAPGWLNLGLWDGPGSEDEAEKACRRLVETMAAVLPAGGVIVDVGNGLGTQDPVIAQVVHPSRLVAVNVAEWQLVAGRDRLAAAAAAPVVGDAVRLPIAAGSADGIISVEAAFHFRSRKAFFDECYRVLRPGGVVSISDIATQRWPRDPAELIAGLTQLRLFGLRPNAAMTATTDHRRRSRGRPDGRAGNELRRPCDRPGASAHGGAAITCSGRAHGASGSGSRAAVASGATVATPDHRLSAAARGTALTRPGSHRVRLAYIRLPPGSTAPAPPAA